MAPANHVPAWKKLGLKLKYAKEAPEPKELPEPVIPSIETPTQEQRKRKYSLKDAEDKPSSGRGKRTKMSTDVSVQPPSRDQTPTTMSRKRKSVSFTPDTKSADGGKPAKELYQKRLSEEMPELEPEILKGLEGEERTTAPSPLPVSDSTPKVKRAKKVKKSKSTLLASQPTTKASPQPGLASEPEHVSPVLQYLRQYHTARPNWKFNKTKQNQLLKQALDMSKIPHSDDEGLASYIEGLEGKQARIRLYVQAKDWIATDDIALANCVYTPPSTTAALAIKAKKPKKKASKTAEPEKPDDDGKPTEDTPVKEPPGHEKLRKEYESALARAKLQIEAGQFSYEEETLADDPAWQARLFNRKRAELARLIAGRKLTGHEKRTGAVVTTVSIPDTKPAINRAGDDTESEWRVRPGIVESVGSVVVVPKNDEHKPNSAKAADVPATTANGKRKRKRKRRTGLPDDDSSSSESSSDSNDSDSDSDEVAKSKEKAPAATVQEALKKSAQALRDGMNNGKAGAASDSSSESDNSSVSSDDSEDSDDS